jgi:hypothetical protein
MPGSLREGASDKRVGLERGARHERVLLYLEKEGERHART